MKKVKVYQWVFITIVVILVSNIIQFYIFNNKNTEQKGTITFQPIYESKYNIYADYSNRVQNVYRFLIQLDNTKTPNDSYLLSEGFITGMSADYYTYLESLIRNIDSADYNEELNHIIETNKNLQLMIYELKNYFVAHQNADTFPEGWGKIKALLKETCLQLASESSKDTNLYNITSYPENFITKSDYPTTMASLNQKFATLVNLLH
ncbi:hypothetical protein [Paenibacillus sp. FSL K6-2393]|uniref:hypothetical protein n=1 Tax=Paenibacillus sp. FSL K6-2393 TaxID=2921475 RepID=UPI0030FB29B0